MPPRERIQRKAKTAAAAATHDLLAPPKAKRPAVAEEVSVTEASERKQKKTKFAADEKKSICNECKATGLKLTLCNTCQEFQCEGCESLHSSNGTCAICCANCTTRVNTDRLNTKCDACEYDYCPVHLKWKIGIKTYCEPCYRKVIKATPPVVIPADDLECSRCGTKDDDPNSVDSFHECSQCGDCFCSACSGHNECCGKDFCDQCYGPHQHTEHEGEEEQAPRGASPPEEEEVKAQHPKKHARKKKAAAAAAGAAEPKKKEESKNKKKKKKPTAAFGMVMSHMACGQCKKPSSDRKLTRCEGCGFHYCADCEMHDGCKPCSKAGCKKMVFVEGDNTTDCAGCNETFCPKHLCCSIKKDKFCENCFFARLAEDAPPVPVIEEATAAAAATAKPSKQEVCEFIPAKEGYQPCYHCPDNCSNYAEWECKFCEQLYCGPHRPSQPCYVKVAEARATKKKTEAAAAAAAAVPEKRPLRGACVFETMFRKHAEMCHKAPDKCEHFATRMCKYCRLKTCEVHLPKQGKSWPCAARGSDMVPVAAAAEAEAATAAVAASSSSSDENKHIFDSLSLGQCGVYGCIGSEQTYKCLMCITRRCWRHVSGELHFRKCKRDEKAPAAATAAASAPVAPPIAAAAPVAPTTKDKKLTRTAGFKPFYVAPDTYQWRTFSSGITYDQANSTCRAMRSMINSGEWKLRVGSQTMSINATTGKEFTLLHLVAEKKGSPDNVFVLPIHLRDDPPTAVAPAAADPPPAVYHRPPGVNKHNFVSITPLVAKECQILACAREVAYMCIVCEKEICWFHSDGQADSCTGRGSLPRAAAAAAV